MQETFRSIITEMGGTPTSPMPTKEQDYGLAVGGLIIHEAGATRMGNDAEDVGAQPQLPGARRQERVRRATAGRSSRRPTRT